MPSVYEFGTVPTGTVMVFRSTAAPTGWVKSTTYTDVAVRVVSGSVSQQTAAQSFSAVFSSSRSATSTLTTLAIANLPSHNHGIRWGDGGGSYDTHSGAGSTSSGSQGNTTGTLISGANITDDSLPHSHSTSDDFNIKYVDYILATKD